MKWADNRAMEDNGKEAGKPRTLKRVYRGMIIGYFRIVSIPNLRPFGYYSLYKPPFRERSGEVALIAQP